MANGSRINKIKCIVKKWQRFARLGRPYSSLSSSPTNDHFWHTAPSDSEDTGSNPYQEKVPKGYEVVFVGKTRRRYVISAHYLTHPLLRVLIQKSEVYGSNRKEDLTIACEVVLFEHLLWMLENAAPLMTNDFLEELVELYAC
eukprot:Gb_38666 [translate_table: standard]